VLHLLLLLLQLGSLCLVLLIWQAAQCIAAQLLILIRLFVKSSKGRRNKQCHQRFCVIHNVDVQPGEQQAGAQLGSVYLTNRGYHWGCHWQCMQP
jgi:hypothetical protein